VRGVRLVALATAIYAAAAGVLVTIHWSRWQTGVDTGIYTQIILNTPHGFTSAFENGSHFAVHFSPIVGVLYPLLALAPSGLTLQYVQVALIAAAPLALYGFVRPHMDELLATRIGLLALFYPPLAAVGIGEFHPLAFLPILALGLVWSADRGRWPLFVACAVLVVLIQEDVLLELVVIGAGAGIALLRARDGVGSMMQDARQRRAFGIASLGLGAAAGALVLAYFGAIQPAYGRFGWFPLVYYGYARGGIGAVTSPPVPAPPTPEASLLVLILRRATYLLEAFVPLALFPLRTWWWLLAAPGLLIVLAATSASIWTMGSHYALLWAPWLLIATAVSLIALGERSGTAAARRWSGIALGVCIVFWLLFNPMHPHYYLRAAYPNLTAAQRAFACVPAGATLATHDEWFTHIAAHNAQASGGIVDGVDYLVYADDYPDEFFQREVKPKLEAAVAAGRYRSICAFGPVHAYQRLAGK
jgi:uncharacterized membrane protein